MGRRRKLAGLRVLITGASQGIGRAMAIDAAKRGFNQVAQASFRRGVQFGDAAELIEQPLEHRVGTRNNRRSA